MRAKAFPSAAAELRGQGGPNSSWSAKTTYTGTYCSRIEQTVNMLKGGPAVMDGGGPSQKPLGVGISLLP